jgi:hypothetical protein
MRPDEDDEWREAHTPDNGEEPHRIIEVLELLVEHELEEVLSGSAEHRLQEYEV